MKRSHRLGIILICAMLVLLGAEHHLTSSPVHAQQSTQPPYDDGTFYIDSSVDVDSNYYLYSDSYMEVEFDEYEEIDSIEVDAYADEDGQPVYSDSDYGDDYDPAEVKLQSDDPVATGHEYGLASEGYACYDDGEGNCDDWEYVGGAYGSVYVQSPPPLISSISPSTFTQGDQGTNFIISGSNFIENSTDQLTINVYGGTNPFTLISAPSTCTSSCQAKFSYDFTGYPAGQYKLSVSNNEAQSDYESFTVSPSQTVSVPPVDPCAVTSSSEVGFTSIVPTATPGGSGTMAVSFSGAAFAAVHASVTYGPDSTPSSIAANIAALISRTYYRYGLGARAFGPIVVYSGNTSLGAVSNVASGSSFTTDASPAAGAQAANACRSAAAPPKSMYAVAYSAYIPVDHVAGPPVDQCTYNAPGLGDIGVVHLYRGDAYHNTYRVTQAVSLNFATSQSSGPFSDTGTTENYGFGSPYNVQSANLSSQDDDAVFLDLRGTVPTGTADCYLRDEVGKAKTTGWLLSPTVTNGAAIVGMAGSGQNPLSLPVGSIQWSMTTYINAGSSTGHVAYQHTCYPAHQVKVANTTLYLYTPPSSSSVYIVNCLTGINGQVTGTSSTKTIR